MTEEVKQKHISFSEYHLYRSCPYRWYSSYVLKEKSPTSEPLVFGSAIHSSIEKIIKENPSKILYSSILEGNLKKEGGDVFAKTFFGKNMLKEGVSLLTELDYNNRFKDWEVLKDEEGNIKSVEEDLYLPLIENNKEIINFKGFIDYSAKSLIDPSRYLVLDWKTGHKEWNLEKKVGNLKFSTYSKKLENKDLLTEEEKKDLHTKLFFGQTALYKHFYSVKHNIKKEDISIGYCSLIRNPVKIQEYIVNIEDSFINYVLSDIKTTAIEVDNLKIRALEEDITKELLRAKTIGLKSSCLYCDLKKKC